MFTITTSVLGEGTHTLTARATDAAGNQGASSTAFHVTIDTLPPAVAITTIEGGDDLINAAEAAGGITVSGTAEIGSTLTVNGVAVPVDASGGWTTSVAPAGDGPLTVTAVATDAAGNTATATHELTVDTVPPAVAITTIEGGDDLINAAEAAGGVTVSGTAEIGSTLTVNGVPVTVDASGDWTTSVAPPAVDGPLTVTAVATDAAGNTATATHALTVDTAVDASFVRALDDLRLPEADFVELTALKCFAGRVASRCGRHRLRRARPASRSSSCRPTNTCRGTSKKAPFERPARRSASRAGWSLHSSGRECRRRSCRTCRSDSITTRTD